MQHLYTRFSTLTVFLFLLMLTIFSGCQKYEHGPALSLRSAEKRLEQTWRVTYAENIDSLRDITAEFALNYYTLDVRPNGTFRLSFQAFNRSTYIHEISGTWKLRSDNTKVDWIFNGEEDIYGLLGRNNSSTIVTKLRNKELWLKNAEGNIEVHFTPVR